MPVLRFLQKGLGFLFLRPTPSEFHEIRSKARNLKCCLKLLRLRFPPSSVSKKNFTRGKSSFVDFLPKFSGSTRNRKNRSKVKKLIEVGCCQNFNVLWDLFLFQSVSRERRSKKLRRWKWMKITKNYAKMKPYFFRHFSGIPLERFVVIKP